ncbi:MAG: hypothetical protein ACTHKS_07750 [Gaiellaceae bacterium]
MRWPFAWAVAAFLTLVAPASATTPPASSFSAHVSNAWFPLLSGTRWVYHGVKDGKRAVDVVVVTHATRTIDGVPCVSVDDRLTLGGHLEERTTDWYSQDARGNVWYFGERTAELDRNGKVTSTEGSWLAGADGAQPGVFMPAHPRVGQSARQEFYKGHAEDHFKVVGLFNTVSPRGPANTLLTEETTPLEPGTVDHKLYVRGIGTVLEQTERGGDERNELVSVTRMP